MKYKDITILAVILLLVISLVYISKRWSVPKRLYKKSVVYKPVHNKKHIKKYAIHGIDVSHHQGKISWDKLKHINPYQKIDFVYIRATNGRVKDRKFDRNWKLATKNNFTIGAYHYYSPNINSNVQAKNFINTVSLSEGNLPPVIDIEKIPHLQSRKNWRKGIINFISILEKHYHIKPIIYSGDSFYASYLATDSYFKNYTTVWIANYNNVLKPKSNWHFWQVSESEKVQGIRGFIDYNIFYGTKDEFDQLKIKKKVN